MAHYIKEVNSYLDEDAEAKAEEFLSKVNKQKVKDAIESIVENEFDRLRDFGGDFISSTAARRAEKLLFKVLEGDPEAMMALLGDTEGQRRRGIGHDAGEPWASAIRGTIFETEGIALRRKIIAAHPELLSNERIKDLESIVEGLKNQIVMLEQTIEHISSSRSAF